jgi:acylphosphatase
VIVRGRVQGVFFRDSCRREAVSRGVSGWVRNRWDGAVEAVFEGSPDAVDALCRWCETGPPHARVESLEVTEEKPRGESEFRVRG